MTKTKSAIYANIVAALLLSGTGIAHAVTTTHSSAYGVKADLQVLRGTVAAVAATGSASGSAPGAYDRTTTVAKVTQSAKLVDGLVLDGSESLTTGLITNRAWSGYPATVDAAASSSVDGLSLAFTTQFLNALPILSLGVNAGTLTSTASVGVGADGRLVSAGGSTIEGLTVGGSLLGLLNIDGGLYANAKPNTEIRLAGLSILLNEQQEVRSGTGDLFRFTNAIRIALTDYVLAGSVVTGNIIIGHSEAGISGYVPGVVPPAAGAVPEPATWGMMLLGFGLVGAACRRSGRVPAKAAA